MEYGNKLRRAWEITWKYKFLWIFGIAMAFCRGTNSFRFNSRSSGGRGDFGGDVQPLPPQVTEALQNFISSGMIWWALGGLVLLIVLFWLVGMAVVAYTRGSLVRSVNRLEENLPLDLRQAWEEGKARFAPLFGLEFLLGVPGMVIGVGILVLIVFFFAELMRQGLLGMMNNMEAVSTVILQSMAVFVVLFCGLACVSIIYQIIAAILATFGSRAIALEEMGVIAGIGRGWSVFSKNIGVSIIVALILFGIGLVLTILLAIPVIGVLGGFIIFMMATIRQSPDSWVVIAVVFGLLVILLSLFFNAFMGVYYVFSETLWTLSYREFTGLSPKKDESGFGIETPSSFATESGEGV